MRAHPLVDMALAILVTVAAGAGCEPFLADLPDPLPPTDGPGPGDTAPPTVFFAAPEDGAVVAGTVTVEVSAVDAEGPVRAVALSIDDVAAGAREAPPFTFDVATAGLGDGPHTFKAVATDAAGNEAEAVLTLVVTNVAPQLRIDAPVATQSDRDIAVVITSQVPLRSLALRLDDVVVESVGDAARRVFTATVRVPPASAPAVIVSAIGTDDEGQEGSRGPHHHRRRHPAHGGRAGRAHHRHPRRLALRCRLRRR
jgi:hypothetical protein